MVRKQKKILKWEKKNPIKRSKQKNLESGSQSNMSENKKQDKNINERIGENIKQGNLGHYGTKQQQFNIKSQVEVMNLPNECINSARVSANLNYFKLKQQFQSQQLQNLNQQKSLFELIKAKINEDSDIYEREAEIMRIKQFLCSATEYILYVCGVVGTGKTTAILHTITQMRISHKLVNCFTQNKQQSDFIQSIKIRFKDQSQGVLVVDQCDQVCNLHAIIGFMREKKPQVKLILICNNSCDVKFKGKNRVYRLYFMPYAQQQFINVAKLKLGTLILHIPSHILTQAVKKASKLGGDFRQVQKYITNWCDSKNNMKQVTQNNERQNKNKFNSNFADSTDYFLKLLISRNSYNQNNLLLQTIKSQQKQQEERKKNKSKKAKYSKCRCEKNTLRKLIKEVYMTMPKDQCQLNLKLWEQMGILKLSRGICTFHKVEAIIVSICAKKQVLRNAISKQFYSYS